MENHWAHNKNNLKQTPVKLPRKYQQNLNLQLKQVLYREDLMTTDSSPNSQNR